MLNRIKNGKGDHPPEVPGTSGQTQVPIDTLDGAGFETLCAEIYRRLGNSVENVQHTGDEGRDLIIVAPDGKITVAECKHWPDGTVGRPVIQKLHSAVMTLPAEKGIVLTTGTFAKQAYDYLEKVAEPIELIDGIKLKDLAARAGITLVGRNSPGSIQAFPIAESNELKRRLDNDILDSLLSYPQPASSMFRVNDHNVQLWPIFLVRYSFRQELLSGSRVVHRVNEPDGLLLFRGDNGEPLPPIEVTFVKETTRIPFSRINAAYTTEMTHRFNLGLKEIIQITKEQVIRSNRTTVSYRGGNNQDYAKEFVPTAKNIAIKDVRQVYVPEHSFKLEARIRHYDFQFLDTGSKLLWKGPLTILNCWVCNRKFNTGLLCNACGATAHTPGFVLPHSFRCTGCRKTICKGCAYWVPRWKFFKKILCNECTEHHPREIVRKLWRYKGPITVNTASS